ncbi:MAG: glycosyltransferase family 8 protein [Gammaproteobacteria bacterium]|nr:glycosyltransferase family 8 protein [Gammaproteobacteria bacterium]
MKKAIFTIMIGDDPTFEYTKKAMIAYAKKVSAELIVHTKNQYPIGKGNKLSPAKAAWLEKFHLKKLLEKYERVLYLDADIIITPHAPNIFETCPRLDAMYMLNEGYHDDRTKPIEQISSILSYDQTWPTKEGKAIYYNAGVMLFSRDANLFNYANLADLHTIYNDVYFYEQTYFNYLIAKHHLPMCDLALEYNRMEFFGINEDRLKAYFIHYAGMGYSGKAKYRYRTLIADYHRLYGDTDNMFVKTSKQIKYTWIYHRNSLRRLLAKIKKWSANPSYYLQKKINKTTK